MLWDSVDTAVPSGLLGRTAECAMRDGAVLEPRLTPYALPAPNSDADPALRDSTVLITGGYGVLGLALARHLVTRGAHRLVLVGRRGPSPRARQVVRALEAMGASVSCEAADVSAVADVAWLAARLPIGPVAVYHAAGVLADATLLAQTPATLAAALAPKARGVWALRCLSLERPVSRLVLFSSVVAALGCAGQGNYAAANAFLDAFAAHHRARGHPAVSVAWGPWAGEGMAAGERSRQALQAQGLVPLSVSAALLALDGVQRQPSPRVIVATFRTMLRWHGVGWSGVWEGSKFSSQFMNAAVDTDSVLTDW